MTLVLLNDVDDSHTPHLFFVHNNRASCNIFKNQQTPFGGETSEQEQLASVQKKKTKKDAQMPVRSSHNEGMVELRCDYTSRGREVIHLGFYH